MRKSESKSQTRVDKEARHRSPGSAPITVTLPSSLRVAPPHVGEFVWVWINSHCCCLPIPFPLLVGIFPVCFPFPNYFLSSFLQLLAFPPSFLSALLGLLLPGPATHCCSLKRWRSGRFVISFSEALPQFPNGLELFKRLLSKP